MSGFTVAIVGRPNVGKSTFFNRMLEQRKAIVEDTPGVTRDRQYGVSEWNGKTFNIIDTGGFVPFGVEIFEKEMALLADKLRTQGMIRFHSSRLFLPEGKLMMGNWLEYKDMAAYEDCNKIWEKNGEEFFEKYGEIMAEVKITAYRGQVALDWS